MARAADPRACATSSHLSLVTFLFPPCVGPRVVVYGNADERVIHACGVRFSQNYFDLGVAETNLPIHTGKNTMEASPHVYAR